MNNLKRPLKHLLKVLKRLSIRYLFGVHVSHFYEKLLERLLEHDQHGAVELLKDMRMDEDQLRYFIMSFLDYVVSKQDDEMLLQIFTLMVKGAYVIQIEQEEDELLTDEQAMMLEYMEDMTKDKIN